MKNYRFGLFLIIFLFNFCYAQKLKTEKLNFVKKIEPKIIKANSPVDIALIRTTSAEELKTNNLFQTYVHTPAYLTNNKSNPVYLAIINYNYKPSVKRKNSNTNTSIEVVLKSNTDATLFLIERGKGLFYTENITLDDNSHVNFEVDASNSASVYKTTFSNEEGIKFLEHGNFSPEIINQLEKVQIERLTAKAYTVIR